jgi:hypothetical protein
MSEGTGTTEKDKQPPAQEKRTNTTSTTMQDVQTQPFLLAGVLSQEDKQTLSIQADYGVVKIEDLNVYASLDTPQSKREEFNAGSPVPSHIGGCLTTFPFVVAESPKIGETGGKVSEPKRTSIPPTCTRNYPGMRL